LDVVEALRPHELDMPVELAPDFDAVAHALSLVGRRFRVSDYYEVGREKVREYARSVQDYHPIHWDDDIAKDYGYPSLVASPTFSCLLGSVAQKALAEILTGYDLTTAIQTEQVLDFHRPFTVGDRLTSNIVLRSFRQAFGGDLLVIENKVTNQDDKLMLTAATSLIARTGPVERNDKLVELMTGIIRRDILSGPSPEVLPCPTTPVDDSAHGRGASGGPRRKRRALSFDDIAVGDSLPSRVVHLTLGDLVNYAGVSGDPNPIHWNAPTAELVGLEHGIVAHGMLTMGLGAGFVTSWLDDPGALRQFSVRMTSPVYVPGDRPGHVEYDGKVKSLDPDTRTAVVAITALHAGRKIFGRATATVQLS